jgi:dolichol kinase
MLSNQIVQGLALFGAEITIALVTVFLIEFFTDNDILKKPTAYVVMIMVDCVVLVALAVTLPFGPLVTACLKWQAVVAPTTVLSFLAVRQRADQQRLTVGFLIMLALAALLVLGTFRWLSN